MAVSFFYHVAIAVCFFDFRAVFECAWVCAKAHRSADFLAFLVGQNVDDVAAAFGKFTACGVFYAKHVASVFDDGDLHAEADSQIRYFVRAGVFAGCNHALNASCAEAAGDDDSVNVFKFFFDVFVGYGFAVHPFEFDARFVCAARVLVCLDERDVRVAKGNVFAHDCDFCFDGFDFEVGNFLFPIGQVAFFVERERVCNCFIKSVSIEHDGSIVKAFDGGAGHDGVLVYRAEKRDFFDDFFGRGFVRACDYDVGEDAEALQFAHGVLHGL